jgi:hypothetical protein
MVRSADREMLVIKKQVFTYSFLEMGGPDATQGGHMGKHQGGCEVE